MSEIPPIDHSGTPPATNRLSTSSSLSEGASRGHPDPAHVALQASNIEVDFGGNVALAGVTIAVGRGETVGIVGPNGSGKTTLLNAISGFAPATGVVELASRIGQRAPWRPSRMRLTSSDRLVDISGASPLTRSRLGIARTFQVTKLPTDIRVHDFLALLEKKGSSERALSTSIVQALDLVGLEGVEASHIGELTAGQLRLVELAAVAMLRPILALLDEPTAGLSRAEAVSVARAIRYLRDQDIAILCVEHDLQWVGSISNRVIVLAEGRVVANGAPADVARAIDTHVRGRGPVDNTREDAPSGEVRTRRVEVGSGPQDDIRSSPRKTMLAVRGLCAGYLSGRSVVENASFALDAGEVLALVGPNGTGKTTLIRCIAGLHRPSNGTIEFKGDQLGRENPRKRLASGLVVVPEGRPLFSSLTVAENLSLAEDVTPTPRSIESAVLVFPALTSLLDRYAGELSGGQQQMLSVAMALVQNPDVLVLDEPCLGLSEGLASSLMDAIMATAKATALAVILVEESEERAARYSDRVVTSDTWWRPDADYSSSSEGVDVGVGGPNPRVGKGIID